MWINKIFPNNLQLSPFHLPIFLFVFFPWNWHTHKPNTIWNPFMGHTAIPDDKQAEVWACYASATFPNEKFLRIGRLLASRCWKKRNPTEGKHAFLGVRIDVMFFQKKPIFQHILCLYMVWWWSEQAFFWRVKGFRGFGACHLPSQKSSTLKLSMAKMILFKRQQLEEAGFFSDINCVVLYIHNIYIYIYIYMLFGDIWGSLDKTPGHHLGVGVFQKF